MQLFSAAILLRSSFIFLVVQKPNTMQQKSSAVTFSATTGLKGAIENGKFLCTMVGSTSNFMPNVKF